MTTIQTHSDATVLEISASGEVSVVPDQATISFSVETTADDANDALRKNAVKMAAIVTALSAIGVAEKDIQTSSIRIEAQHVHVQGQLPSLRGYKAFDGINATTRDLAGFGDIIDKAISAGVTAVRNIQLGLTDRSAAEKTAQVAAINGLMEKAAFYAQAAGYTVGRLLKFSDGTGILVPQRPVLIGELARGGGGVVVQPGEFIIRAEVYGTYELFPI